MTSSGDLFLESIGRRLDEGDVRAALDTFASGWAVALADDGFDTVARAASRFSPDDFLENKEALAARVLLFTVDGPQNSPLAEPLRHYLTIQGPSDAGDNPLGPVTVRRFLTISAGLICAYFAQGNPTEAARFADTTRDELRRASLGVDLFPDRAAAEAHRWFRTNSGAVYMAIGRMASARDEWAMIDQSPLSASVTWNTFIGRSMAALDLAVSGSIGDTLRAVDEAKALGRAGGWYSGKDTAISLAAAAIAEVNALRVDDASATLDRILVAVGSDAYWKLIVEPVACEISRLRGKPDEALARLRNILHGYDVDRAFPMLLDTFHYLQAGLNLAAGRPGIAISDLHTLGQSADHVLCFASREAIGWLALGLTRTAMTLTDPCVVLGAHHNRATMTQVLAVRAAAFTAAGRTNQALLSIRELFDLVVDYGAASVTLLPSIHVDWIIELAAANSIAVPALFTLAREYSSATLSEIYGLLGRLTRSQRLLLGRLRGPATLEEIAESMYATHNTVEAAHPLALT